MKESRKQTTRLIKFCNEMRLKRYPNSESFAALLRRADIDENLDVACTPRTVQRDIDFLRNTYQAPMEFDAVRNGYYLTDPGWTPEIQLPLEHKDFLINSLLAVKTLQQIAPQPLKKEMAETIEQARLKNRTSFLDDAFIESLLMASGMKVVISPMVFKAVIDAWRSRKSLKIRYCDPKGNVGEREIEPHVVAFHRGLWYIKGYKLPAREIRTLAVHRITIAESGENSFEFDQLLLAETQKNGLFTYPKIEGVTLRCDASIAFYLKEHQVVKRFKMKPAPNGDLFITLGPAFEHEVIRWVLGEAGRIEVLHPPELRRKIAAAGHRIAEVNGD